MPRRANFQRRVRQSPDIATGPCPGVIRVATRNRLAASLFIEQHRRPPAHAAPAGIVRGNVLARRGAETAFQYLARRHVPVRVVRFGGVRPEALAAALFLFRAGRRADGPDREGRRGFGGDFAVVFVGRLFFRGFRRGGFRVPRRFRGLVGFRSLFAGGQFSE